MGYQITRPDAEQLRFNSSTNGPIVLDDYLEAAELGGRALSALLLDLFNSSGVLRTLATPAEVTAAINSAAAAAASQVAAYNSEQAAAASAASIAGGPVTSVAGKSGIVTLVKGDVGLGNVDNTSDATKLASTSTLTNKTIALGSNTVSGTLAQFNAACTDADFATTSVQSFSGAQRGAISELTDGATVTPDFSLANNYNLRLGGNRTLAVPTNVVQGQQGLFNIWQDNTGSRTLAYQWVYSWAGGNAGTLSTAGCTRDMLAYSVDYYSSGAFTVTIATPGVFTKSAHGFISGQKCQLSTTGALPTGLTSATTYYIRVIDANTFYLCTTLANSASGTYIATSGTQSGTHTITCASIALSLSKAVA